MMDLPRRPTDPTKGGPLGDGLLTAAKVPPKGGPLGDGSVTNPRDPPKGGVLDDGSPRRPERRRRGGCFKVILVLVVYLIVVSKLTASGKQRPTQ